MRLICCFFICLSFGWSFETNVFFVNEKYGDVEENGFRRVVSSRNGVGVDGLEESMYIPCTPDAEVHKKVTIEEVFEEEKFSLYPHGFEFGNVSSDVLDVLRNDKFPPSIGDVMNTVEKFSNLSNAMFLRVNPITLHRKNFLCITCQGFIVRKVGPMGDALDEKSGFPGGAQGVHIDQDLNGSPLSKMGISWLFRIPFVELVNIWMPLKDAIIRPLILMDMSSLNELQNVYQHKNGNDMFLIGYNESQKFFFRKSEFGKAAIFFTGRTPHASASIPGEDCLAKQGRNCKHEIVRKYGFENLQSRESIEMRCVILLFPSYWTVVFCSVCFVLPLLFWKNKW